MKILGRPPEVSALTESWRRDGAVAFVPTMGCLHRGHLALVERAKALAPKVVVSIFVNPLQFGPHEDFEKYPRPFEVDRALLEEAGVDLLFHPTPADLYPEPFLSRVSVSALGDHLCGAARPGHFEGVTTVCLKLFRIVRADLAIFGEKDFQQLRVLQQMTTDLNLGVEIIPHPIVREPDGLALSSRNRYLSASDRERAVALPRALNEAREMARATEPAGAITRMVRTRLEEAGFVVDYVHIAAAQDLRPVTDDTRMDRIPAARIFVAAKLGTTRLIDNIAL